MKKIILYILILITSFNLLNAQEITYIEKYIKNPSLKEPTLNDYKKVGIDSVNKDNIKETNRDLRLLIEKKEYFFNDNTTPYHYYPDLNYIYDFNQSRAEVTDLPLKDREIDLSNIKIDNNETIFIKVKLFANTLGKYFLPYVKIFNKKRVYKESFEKNTQGIRYLNITGLVDKSSKKLKLESKLFNIPNQIISIIKFKNPQIKNKKILIIAPHPDDAEIATYGLYSKFPKNSYIITVTAGDAGPGEIYEKLLNSMNFIYNEKAKERVIDSITVPLIAGVPHNNLLNLGFFDGKLYDMYKDKNKSVAATYTWITNVNKYRRYNISNLNKKLKGGKSNWNTLVENFKQLINIINPEIIVTVYPAIDRHPDHRFSTLALFEALKKLDRKKGKLFLYTNHLPNCELYPFGERLTISTLPPSFRNLYFDSIYSSNISYIKNVQKTIALERMSDIRYDYNGKVYESLCKKKSPLSCVDYSYFRRAIRKNELFFVVDIAKLLDNNIYKKLIEYKPSNQFFKAEPFENMVSKEIKLKLTKPIKKATFYIDKISNFFNYIKINGWAYVKEVPIDKTKIYILLKSDKKRYILTTNKQQRNDVAKAFNNRDLSKSGFYAYIDSKKLIEDKYKIYILLINGNNQYLVDTNKYLKVK